MHENQTGLTPLEAEKPRKYGGAPTKQGLELFTKLALTEDHLRIAGVLVGSGIVSDDVYIGDMTQLVEPVGIGTCSEPIRNGATVNMTVEVRSDLNKDLPNGMTIREFLIQAWDGEAKIAIYYGCLADYPQYIAPWEEGYLDVRRYPVSIRLAPSVKVDLDDSLPGVVMTIDDIKDYCISTLLPQLLTASQNQIVNHNLAEDAHPALRTKIEKAQQAADDAATAAAKAQQTADSAVQAAENNSGGCALRITFAEVFAGQTYTVSGSEESYTGTVPEGLVVQVKLKQCGTTYTIRCTDAEGEEYSSAVVTGPYFGQYTASLLPFSAMRRAAKAVNFGIVYGISDFSLSQDEKRLFLIRDNCIWLYSIPEERVIFQHEFEGEFAFEDGLHIFRENIFTYHWREKDLTCWQIRG